MEGTNIDAANLECSEAVAWLHELRRGRLNPGQRDAIVRHLGVCAACRREDENEALIVRLLTERLPRPPEMSPALRRRLEALCSKSEAHAAEAAGSEVPRVQRRRAWSFRRAVPA